jgi:predicted TIM-barrel fold metal-dependent hydrolase
MPRLDIVDAHHHIWRRADQPWLNGPMVPRIFGAYEAIRRDYATVANNIRQAVAHLPVSAQQQILSETAARLYRL